MDAMLSFIPKTILLGVLCQLILAHSRPDPLRLTLNEVSAQSLETRQISAVIATSEYLRRAHHASAVVGNWLYIDGGDLAFTDGGQTVYQYSNTLLSIDLSRNWTNATVTINSLVKPTGVPNLDHPSLWYHEQEGVLYSGFAGIPSMFGNNPSLPPQSLWAFKPDGAGAGSWSEVIKSSASALNAITQPVQGLQAYGPDSAWYLGGYPAHDSQWVAQDMQWISGMIEFDMASKSFTNMSATDYNMNGTVINGAMHYVPSFGSNGIVIVMGGITLPFNKTGLVGFETVSVFDPAKKEWFNQTTTGNAPSPREEFCVAGINSTNNTYEIFVYAGWGSILGADAVQYDTINILSLPAFNWISVPYNPQNPRQSHTCNAVGGNQIIIIGGADSDSNITFGTALAYTESIFNTSADPFSQGLAIFDMTALQFADQYTAGTSAYEQSEPIKEFYSQSKNYYQQNLTPGVAALLQVTNFTNTTTLTPVSPLTPNTNTNTSTPIPSTIYSHHTPARAIAGSVIGGLAFATLLLISVLYLLKHKRAAKNKNNKQIPVELAPYAKILPGRHELPNETRPWELKEQTLSEVGMENHALEMGQLGTPVHVHEL